MAASTWVGRNPARVRLSNSPKRVQQVRPNALPKLRIRFDFDAPIGSCSHRVLPFGDTRNVSCLCHSVTDGLHLTRKKYQKIRHLDVCLRNRQWLRTLGLADLPRCSTELFDKLIPTFGGYE